MDNSLLLLSYEVVVSDSETIATRIYFIGHIGIISAALVIARRISIISTETQTYPGAYTSSRRRMIVIDLIIALSLPVAHLIICESCP